MPFTMDSHGKYNLVVESHKSSSVLRLNTADSNTGSDQRSADKPSREYEIIEVTGKPSLKDETASKAFSPSTKILQVIETGLYARTELSVGPPMHLEIIPQDRHLAHKNKLHKLTMRVIEKQHVYGITSYTYLESVDRKKLFPFEVNKGNSIEVYADSKYNCESLLFMSTAFSHFCCMISINRADPKFQNKLGGDIVSPALFVTDVGDID
jgi:hypothetical protein